MTLLAHPLPAPPIAPAEQLDLPTAPGPTAPRLPAARGPISEMLLASLRSGRPIGTTVNHEFCSKRNAR